MRKPFGPANASCATRLSFITTVIAPFWFRLTRLVYTMRSAIMLTLSGRLPPILLTFECCPSMYQEPLGNCCRSSLAVGSRVGEPEPQSVAAFGVGFGWPYHKPEVTGTVVGVAPRDLGCRSFRCARRFLIGCFPPGDFVPVLLHRDTREQLRGGCPPLPEWNCRTSRPQSGF